VRRSLSLPGKGRRKIVGQYAVDWNTGGYAPTGRPGIIKARRKDDEKNQTYSGKSEGGVKTKQSTKKAKKAE